ncbi:uncharacterized protein LOC131598445 [Vicia villosa]|uniref:uncharacterized protein LOC131598445 n=1 Tax=Vicia villosa TaxID=3911 RepID=UPI00273A7C2F|nr:uncharacterized protein LOC131598445 [Vicia villosa]
MQSLFGFHKTLEVVTGGVLVLAADAIEARKTTHNEVKKKDCKAAYCIQTTVDSTNFDRISIVESAKETWDILVKYYERDAIEARKTSHSEVKKKDCKAAYCIQTAVDSTNFDRISHVESAKETWDILVKYYERGEKIKVWSWKKDGGSKKFKGKFDKTQGKKSWSNPHKHHVDDRASESSKRGRGNYRKDKEDKKGVQCYNCEKWGHMSKHCWYRKNNGSTKGKNEGANLARQDSDDSEGGMVVMAAVADNHVESKMWFLDSGCSNHMTDHKAWLVDFDESKKSKVKLADNNSLQVEGTSNIVLQLSNGEKTMIKDVFYVPGMKCNLLIV